MSIQERMAWIIYGWLLIFLIVYALVRRTPPTKLFATYNLASMYLVETLDPARLSLGLAVLCLRV